MTRRAMPFGSLFALAVLAGPAAQAAILATLGKPPQRIFDSPFEAHERIQAESSGRCTAIPTFQDCTLDYTLRYVSPDPEMARFQAIWDAGGFNRTATLGFEVAYARTWRGQVIVPRDQTPPIMDPRPIIFAGVVGLTNGNVSQG